MADKETNIPSDIKSLYDSGQMFRTLGQIRDTANPIEPLWGYFLFKKAITIIIGDPGVCKTTMGYGLASSLCRGEPFLDISAEEPVNALYMDFESSDSLVVSTANHVLSDNFNDVPNFYIYNIVDYHIKHVYDFIVDICKKKKINLIIIDNQTVAFDTRDENDNSEAGKQMKFLRMLANKCNAALVLYHHSSKANAPGTRKGSGAFARMRLTDVGINISIPDIDNPDIVCFEVAKNRMVGERVLWYLKKNQGKFEFTSPPLGVSGQPTNTKIFRAQKAIIDVLTKTGSFYERAQILECLKDSGIDSFIIDNALKRLVQHGRIYRPERKLYALKSYNNQKKDSF